METANNSRKKNKIVWICIIMCVALLALVGTFVSANESEATNASQSFSQTIKVSDSCEYTLTYETVGDGVVLTKFERRNGGGTTALTNIEILEKVTHEKKVVICPLQV